MKVSNQKVIEAFIDGREASSSSLKSEILRFNNNTMHVLYSYYTIVAFKWNGFYFVTTDKYSTTTSKQCTLLRRAIPSKLLCECNANIIEGHIKALKKEATND
jgi:hypothetical protein